MGGKITVSSAGKCPAVPAARLPGDIEQNIFASILLTYILQESFVILL
jgi:hypothetical protein